MKLRKQKQNHTEEAPARAGASLPLSPSVVRVRMLRRAHTAWGFMEPGRVVRVPATVGNHWIADGIAEQDKSLDGAPETK
jgi:hypothetical protein